MTTAGSAPRQAAAGPTSATSGTRSPRQAFPSSRSSAHRPAASSAATSAARWERSRSPTRARASSTTKIRSAPSLTSPMPRGLRSGATSTKPTGRRERQPTSPAPRPRTGSASPANTSTPRQRNTTYAPANTTQPVDASAASTRRQLAACRLPVLRRPTHGPHRPQRPRSQPGRCHRQLPDKRLPLRAHVQRRLPGRLPWLVPPTRAPEARQPRNRNHADPRAADRPHLRVHLQHRTGHDQDPRLQLAIQLHRRGGYHVHAGRSCLPERKSRQGGKGS